MTLALPHRLALALYAAALLSPVSASAQGEGGSGITAELTLGMLLTDPAIGSASPRLALGAEGELQLGRLLFAQEHDRLRNGLFLDLGWLWGTSSSAGTDWVKVQTSYHALAASIVAGYPVGIGAESHLILYGKLGPALFLTPLTYDVQGGATSYLGVKGGLVCGLGARLNLYATHALGLALRLEALGMRRGYLDDLVLAVGLGLAM